MLKKKQAPITPEAFASEMKKLLDPQNYPYYADGEELDKEECHSAMDYLMCEVLYSLGYAKGVNIFVKTDKWYA